LAAMQTTGHSRYFRVGMTQHWVVIARIDHNFVRKFLRLQFLLAVEREGVPHDALGLPRFHPLQLLRKSLRIGGCRECFFAENRGDLMLPMTVARSPAEAQYNHVGTESPD